jgi:hypothetical protein
MSVVFLFNTALTDAQINCQQETDDMKDIYMSVCLTATYLWIYVSFVALGFRFSSTSEKG